MKNHTCGSHAKKCKSSCSAECSYPSGGPVCGRQGEWTQYRQYSPLHEEGESGYNEGGKNWEDVLVISEMRHAQEMKTWADRYKMLDLAYRSKVRKLEADFQQTVENGFEEAYETLREMQALVKEKEARITTLEAIISECCPEQSCNTHDQQVS